MNGKNPWLDTNNESPGSTKVCFYPHGLVLSASGRRWAPQQSCWIPKKTFWSIHWIIYIKKIYYDYMIICIYLHLTHTYIYIFTLYIHTYLDHIHICIYNYICTVLTAHYCKWCNDSGASSFHNPCCPESTTTKMMDDVKAPTVAKTATPVGGFLVVYFAARKQTCHATRLSLEWNEWSSSPGIFYQWTASSCINVCRQ